MADAQAHVVDLLVVCYNGRGVIDDCLRSVLASKDPGVKLRVTVVDNASSDGSADHVAANFPTVELVRSGENLGFAGGNNRGWEHIQTLTPGSEFVFLLNQDTVVRSGFLEAAVGFLEEHPEVGCAQSKLLLHETSVRALPGGGEAGRAGGAVINTVGNRSHYLGFGLMTGYLEVDRGQFDTPGKIDFASGAAAIVRSSLLREYGLFEDVFFMYLEDADLSWKLAQVGAETWSCPGSVVEHKYSFSSDFKHYYHLERNRWWLLLVYYRLATLGILLPALMAMELGQVYFAISRGVFGQKIRAWGWYLSLRNLGLVWRARRKVQSRRTVGDRQFTADFVGPIEIPTLQSPVLKYVANPVFNAYWKLARLLIWW